jgi:molybdopterin-biosynthesis enzyme MoeA-like protein
VESAPPTTISRFPPWPAPWGFRSAGTGRWRRSCAPCTPGTTPACRSSSPRCAWRIFPKARGGVPSFLRHQFEAIADTLRGTPFHLACLYLRLGEDQLAEPLALAAARFPSVEIGSYPRFDDADHRVRVTVEGRDPLQVRAATRHVLEALPPGAVVRSEGTAP